jgi:hypothetical protein
LGKQKGHRARGIPVAPADGRRSLRKGVDMVKLTGVNRSKSLKRAVGRRGTWDKAVGSRGASLKEAVAPRSKIQKRVDAGRQEITSTLTSTTKMALISAGGTALYAVANGLKSAAVEAGKKTVQRRFGGNSSNSSDGSSSGSGSSSSKRTTRPARKKTSSKSNANKSSASRKKSTGRKKSTARKSTASKKSTSR